MDTVPLLYYTPSSASMRDRNYGAMRGFLVLAGTVPRPVITLYYSALSARALLARSIFAISHGALRERLEKKFVFKRTTNRFQSTVSIRKKKERKKMHGTFPPSRVPPRRAENVSIPGKFSDRERKFALLHNLGTARCSAEPGIDSCGSAPCRNYGKWNGFCSRDLRYTESERTAAVIIFIIIPARVISRRFSHVTPFPRFLVDR